MYAVHIVPQEDREHQKLVVSCRCGYQEDVDPARWCVYRNEVHHTSKERTVILRVRALHAPLTSITSMYAFHMHHTERTVILRARAFWFPCCSTAATFQLLSPLHWRATSNV